MARTSCWQLAKGDFHIKWLRMLLISLRVFMTKCHYFQVNCNASSTYTNSSGAKPDLGVGRDQQ